MANLLYLLVMMPFIDFFISRIITCMYSKELQLNSMYGFSVQHWVLGNIANYVIISWASLEYFEWRMPTFYDVSFSIIMYFVTVDVTFFILHYLCHRMWYTAIHQWHHICKPLQPSCTRNSHWIDACIENSSFSIPFFVFQYNGWVAYFCLIFNAFWIGNLHNGEMIEGLDTLLVRPSHHTIHHQYNGKTSFNYAVYLTVWDRAFSTFKTDSRNQM